MTSKQAKIYIPRDEMLFTWDPEDMDEYWSQCKQYDSHPLGQRIFFERNLVDNKSIQLFNRFKV